MAKFNFSITAHVGNDMMTIYNRDYDTNVTHYLSVLNLTKGCVPCAKWDIDDGEDERDTTYCQYVYYPDGKPGYNYLLAVWTELDENGCMKV